MESLLESFLTSGKEPGNESQKNLSNCGISTLNFDLSGSYFSMLKKPCVTVLE